MLLRLKKNKKGFTLIELIVVVAILAILAAVAVPSFIGLQAKATQGVTIANASAIAGAVNTWNAMQTTAGTRLVSKAEGALKWTDITGTAGLKDLAPSGITAGTEDTACGLIIIDANGVATVDAKIK